MPVVATCLYVHRRRHSEDPTPAAVGGEQLEAALEVLNFGGRVVICGAVSDRSGSGAPTNYRKLIYQELTMRGFTVTAHEDLREQFGSVAGNWLREGKVRSNHTVFDGIDRVPEAFESWEVPDRADVSTSTSMDA